MAQRVMRALVRRAADGDTEALEVLELIRRESAQYTRDAAHELVTFGYSYAELGQVLRISRQAATKRFGQEQLPTAPRVPTRGALRNYSLDERMAAIQPMLDEGWTVEGALNHIEGSCDIMVCTADHAEAS
jgi:hypothetical protein